MRKAGPVCVSIHVGILNLTTPTVFRSILILLDESHGDALGAVDVQIDGVEVVTLRDRRLDGCG